VALALLEQTEPEPTYRTRSTIQASVETACRLPLQEQRLFTPEAAAVLVFLLPVPIFTRLAEAAAGDQGQTELTTGAAEPVRAIAVIAAVRAL
jgi:hypothetical protein